MLISYGFLHVKCQICIFQFDLLIQQFYDILGQPSYFCFERYWEIPFVYTHQNELNFNKTTADIIWLHEDGAKGNPY